MYSGVTETLALLPGLPQTTTAATYTETAAMVGAQGDQVESLIDGYLARRYGKVATTLTAVPPLVRAIAVDLTAYRVYRAYFPKDSVEASDWPDKFKEALKTLEDLRDSKIDLANTAGSLLIEQTADTNITSNTVHYNTTFNEGSFLSWHLDDTKQTDIDNG